MIFSQSPDDENKCVRVRFLGVARIHTQTHTHTQTHAHQQGLAQVHAARLAQRQAQTETP